MSLLRAQEIYEHLRRQNSALEAEIWALRQVAAPPTGKILKALEAAKKEILGAVEAAKTGPSTVTEADLRDELEKFKESLDECSHELKSMKILRNRERDRADEALAALKIANETNDELSRRVNEGIGRHAALSNGITMAEDTIARRGEEVDALRAERDKALANLDDFRRHSEELERLVQQYKVERDKALATITELERLVQTLKEQRDHAINTNDELRDEFKSTEATIDRLGKELEALQANHAATLNTLTAEIDKADCAEGDNTLYQNTLAELNKTKTDRDEAKAEIARLREALYRHVTAADALKEKPIPSAAVKAAVKAYNSSSEAAGFNETMTEVAEAVRKALVGHFLSSPEDEGDK